MEEKNLEEWLENNNGIKKMVFIDTETSHLNGFIVSIALIEIDFKSLEILNKVYLEINPEVNIDPEALSVHNISNKQLKNAPLFKDCFLEIEEILDRNDMICAFNAIYDIGVLIREYERAEIIYNQRDYMDLMSLIKKEVGAKNVKGSLKNPTLEESAKYFNISNENNKLHNALYDTEVLTSIFREATKRIRNEK